MKPWQTRLLTAAIGGTLMLLSSAFSAYKFASTDAGWDSGDFWWLFRIGIAVTVGCVIYLAFCRYD